MIVSKLFFKGKEITKSTPSESVEKNTDKCRASQDLIFENYDDEEEVSFNNTRFDWKLIAIKKNLHFGSENKKHGQRLCTDKEVERE